MNSETHAKEKVSKDAQVMKAIIRNMGIEEWEPKVIQQMLEYSYKYVTDLVCDAKLLSQHARKRNIDAEDARLSALQMAEKYVSAPPARHVISQLAKSKNSIPLPPPKNSHGTRLPPDRFCLTAANYRLKPDKKKIKLSNSSRNGKVSASVEKSPSRSNNLMEDMSWESPLFTLHFDPNIEGQPFSLEQASQQGLQ